MIEPTPEIERLQRTLNAAEHVEPGWYERSHIAYELVCYVNNIVALVLAGNAERIPVLLDRAWGYLNRDDKARLNDAYREAVTDYLRAVARLVAEDESVSERARSFVPKALLADR
jgi:hypothetical protein